MGRNGLAGVGGRTAFGNTDPIRGQRSYAHELTHNFGFNHVTNTIDEVGWDVGARLAGNPAGNNTTGHVKPTNLFDVHVGGTLPNSARIDTPKSISLLGNTSLGFGSGDTQGDIRKKAKRQVLVIRGQLDRKGAPVLRMAPVFRYPWLTQPSPANASGDYVAEVVTTTGGVIRAPFNGGVHDDRAPDRPAFGSFNVMGAAIGQVGGGRIVRDRARKAPVAIKPSRRPPVLSIASPRPKAKLTKR